MTNKKQYLVDLVLPAAGDSTTAKAYREMLANLGYNRFQRSGSIGGARNGGSISITSGMITRN